MTSASAPMPSTSPPAATIAGTITFGIGLVSALAISSRLSSARVGGLSRSFGATDLEEAGDRAVDRLDVLRRPLVVLAARRRGDPPQRLLRAEGAGRERDREHAHGRLAVALRVQAPHHLVHGERRVGVLAV